MLQSYAGSCCANILSVDIPSTSVEHGSIITKTNWMLCTACNNGPSITMVVCSKASLGKYIKILLSLPVRIVLSAVTSITYSRKNVSSHMGPIQLL